MPIIREEYHCRRMSAIAATSVDISTLDVGLRYTTDAQVTPCGSAEVPNFIAAETAIAEAPVSLIYVNRGLRVALRLAGTGSKGAKIACNSSGNFAASATAENAVLGAGDFAVALEDWTAGEYVECDILRGI